MHFYLVVSVLYHNCYCWTACLFWIFAKQVKWPLSHSHLIHFMYYVLYYKLYIRKMNKSTRTKNMRKKLYWKSTVFSTFKTLFSLRFIFTVKVTFSVTICFCRIIHWILQGMISLPFFELPTIFSPDRIKPSWIIHWKR